MLGAKIPFEIHITTESLASNRVKDFIDFCGSQEAKPLLIELYKGDCIHQPMLSKVIYESCIDDVFVNATELSNLIRNHNFKVKRLKIEVPSEYSELVSSNNPSFDTYFEMHCKVNFINTEQLLQLCDKHKVHLSLNSLKNQINTRFITLREFGRKQQFEQRIVSLTNDLKKNNWIILKQESEYCIYDNNNFLDKGWLPQ
jgi:hypothetical protein